MQSGRLIEARRKVLGISRAKLAKRLKTSRVRIWRIETGKTPLRVDDLKPFARVLLTTVGELVA